MYGASASYIYDYYSNRYSYPPDQIMSIVTVRFTPNEIESQVIKAFQQQVDAVRTQINAIPDDAKIQVRNAENLIIGTITGAELKQVLARADFIIDPPGTVYNAGTPYANTQGQAIYNNGDPIIRFNFDTVNGYNALSGGLNFLILHDLSYLAKVVRDYYEQLANNGYSAADRNAHETLTNDIARAIARESNVGIMDNPQYGYRNLYDFTVPSSGGGTGGRGGAGGGSNIPPVVLDLDGDGVELISLVNSKVHIDFDGDGFADRTGWVASDDGILALDANANDLVDGPVEFVFGGASADGFVSDLEALARFDSDGDGWLDGDDTYFDLFRIWQDANQDGIGTADELKALAALGIEAIRLDGTVTGDTLDGATDNVVLATTHYRMTSGELRLAADVVFAAELSSLCAAVLH